MSAEPVGTGTSGRGGNLAVDPDRLWNSIAETAQIGATAKGGICRLALTDLDRQVRDWFVARCEAIGCRVTVDDMGNIFARREGRNPALAPIAVGSHLDTQPTGGKYDGIIGVLAGLELLRTLHETGIKTEAPIEVVNWSNEEGSRFAPAMLSSGVFAGAFSRAWACDRTDRGGERFGTALEAIGYRGAEPCGQHPLSALFELHIEQGPVLEAENKVIGIVTGVQGMRWYEVTVDGQEGHAGATPMRLRQDALLTAAAMVRSVGDIAAAHAPDAVGTVGLIECRPNSRNVVPGQVFFTVDLRHPSDAVLDEMEAAMRARFAEDARGLGFRVDDVWNKPAVRFDGECIAAVREAAAGLGFPAREIISGAGHDAAYVAAVAPTTMIFVPCAGGLSHNEAESAEKDHVAAGANVLLRAVLDTDRRLAAARHGNLSP
ncbi:Zn-dependent hydrolase [Rhizosaccharibacter radicis]|uniref:Zn-dependent hydrolase n=1 Tax=Rhizosaccharibacter radicis TaxID=2782605 RepID=A0ABT1VX19_9PROT|nr:Zn-dependent hydrolase [Acetobacteraceae bacterium KSS12]